MARKITLRDNITGESVYPRTKADSVYRKVGEDTDVALGRIERMQYVFDSNLSLSVFGSAESPAGFSISSPVIQSGSLAYPRICYTAVSAGDVVRISAEVKSNFCRIGFSTVQPDFDVEVLHVAMLDTEPEVDLLVVAPIDGYLLLNLHTQASRHCYLQKDKWTDQQVVLEKEASSNRVLASIGGNTDQPATISADFLGNVEYADYLEWAGYLASNNGIDVNTGTIGARVGSYVYYLPVTAGVEYYVSVYGYGHSGYSSAAAFFEDVPAVGDTGALILTNDEGNGKYIKKSCRYTPETDGYIAVCGRRRTTMTEFKAGVGYEKAISDVVREFAGGDGVIPNRKHQLASLKYAGYRSSYDTLSLLIAGDPHKYVNAMTSFLAFRAKYASYIDDTIHLGDIMGSTFREDYGDGILGTATPFDGLEDFKNVLNVIGNHDVFNGKDDPAPSGHETDVEYWAENPRKYDRYMKYKDYWGTIVQPAGVNDSSSPYYKACYYYKDYSNGIRLIVTDSMDLSTDQVSWFAGVLADALTNNKQVIGVAHIPMDNTGGEDNETLVPFDCNWLGDHHLIKGQRNTSYLEAVKTFQENGGQFICWLYGHFHEDEVGTFANYPGQIYIANPCLTPVGTHQDVVRLYGTPSYDDFNVVSIEPAKKHIRILKVGCDFSRDLRHRGSIIIDYASTPRKVVYEW